MLRTWLAMPVIAAMLALVGCTSNAEKYRPPPQPERYAVPPEDVARFSQPIQYPKEVMKQDTGKKNDDGDAPPPTMRGAGRSGGMGG